MWVNIPHNCRVSGCGDKKNEKRKKEKKEHQVCVAGNLSVYLNIEKKTQLDL